MKIGSKLQFEVPDNCDRCHLKPENFLESFSQGDICSRCPIFNCKFMDDIETDEYWCLINPEEYRDDWAKEWEKCFKEKTYPQLNLKRR